MKRAVKLPLGAKFSIIIMLMSIFIGVLLIAVSYQLYTSHINERYVRTGETTINTAATVINWDSISGYLESGQPDDAYEKTLADLRICAEGGSVEYLFLVVPAKDGCIYVFDTDESEDRLELGTYLDWYEPFKPYQEQLNAGQKIDPIISNDEYGWLLSIYIPFTDSAGNFVGYLGVDYSVEHLIDEQNTFIGQLSLITLLVAIVMTSLFLIILRLLVLNPIGRIADAANSFLTETPAENTSLGKLHELRVNTHDELQTLAESLKTMEEKIKLYISRLEEATHKAETDAMTGALNREAFVRYVEEDLGITNHQDCRVFMMIDLDHFKAINDTYGHTVGDEVLIKCTKIIQSKFRLNDRIGRMGGDEFAVYYRGAFSLEEIETRVASICSEIRQLVFSAPDAQATVSIGVVVFDADAGYNYHRLYIDADKALYDAKEQGRDCFSVRQVTHAS